MLVTRAASQAGEMAAALEALGAIVHAIPAIAIEAIPDPVGLEAALSGIASYDGLVFTSVNGVETFAGHLAARGLDASKTPLAYCVGPRTAEAWESTGGKAARLPEKFTGKDLAEAMGQEVDGGSFLLLRPKEVAAEIAAMLRQRGAKVDEVALYATVADRSGTEPLRELLSRGALQVVTFTSPSSVRGTVEQAGGSAPLAGLFCLCIGPTTARAAKQAGLTSVHFPPGHTVADMVSILPSLLVGVPRR